MRRPAIKLLVTTAVMAATGIQAATGKEEHANELMHEMPAKPQKQVDLKRTQKVTQDGLGSGTMEKTETGSKIQSATPADGTHSSSSGGAKSISSQSQNTTGLKPRARWYQGSSQPERLGSRAALERFIKGQSACLRGYDRDHNQK